MSLTPGTRIGPYEITGHLGSGGMGEVYRAADTTLNRDVALKRLPAAVSDDVDRIARLKREAQLLASLNHPNIAHVYGLETDGDALTLAMELVEGPTLADRIAAGPMSIGDVLPIAQQIAEAIEYAHERGVIHRDLKPANIKVAPDGRVKVLDFGLAKALEGDGSDRGTLGPSDHALTMTSPAITQMGIILGTAAYMSPEQAKGRTADRRADIWSFGVVLYEMLTGRMAFAAETVSETLAQVLMKEPDLGLLPASVPPAIRSLLNRCLTRDPRSRLQAMGEARIAIEDVLAGRTPTPESTGPAEPPAGRRAFLAAAGLAIVFLLATVTLATWRWLEPAPERPTIQFTVPAPEGLQFGTPVLSPDGRYMVHIAADSGTNLRLMIHVFSEATTRVLTGTDGVRADGAWSPNGRDLAFTTGDTIKRVPASGGPAQEICKVTSSATGLSWGAEDEILFSARGGQLFRVSARGGEPVVALDVDASRGERGLSNPVFLPDGRHYFFVAWSDSSRQAYVGSLDSAERVLLDGITSAVRYGSGHVLFLREGSLMAQPFDPDALALTGEAFTVVAEIADPAATSGGFSTSNTGTLAYRSGSRQRSSQLLWFDRTGTQKAVASQPGSFSDIELSLDDRYVAFESGSPGDIYVFDLDTGLTTRVTTDESRDADPVWSPDGRQIAFRGDRDGHVYARAFGVVGADAVLYKGDARESPASWSRDYLTFEADGDIWALPSGGDGQPIRVTETPFSENSSQISPDGRWVAYMSNEPGSEQVFVQSFPDPGVKRQVSSAGGSSPRWSRDGKELFYISPARQMMAVPIMATGTSFDSGAPRALFEVHVTGTGEANYAVSADGRFLVNVPDEDRNTHPVTVILNWMAEVRK